MPYSVTADGPDPLGVFGIGYDEEGELYSASPLPGAVRVDPADPRIDVSAKFALQRMLRGDAGAQQDASGMIGAIQAGRLTGIYGDDLYAAVKVARRLSTERWLLVPKGEDAVLILDPAAPTQAPPTIIFRGGEGKPPNDGVRRIPQRLDPALRKAWASFLLLRAGQLVRCDTGPVGAELGGGELGALVTNLVPTVFCQLRQPRRPRRPVPGPPTVPPVPVLVRSSTAVFLAEGPANVSSGFFCPFVNQGSFSWNVEYRLRFPPSAENGLWRTGFVQNLIADDFEAVYANTPPKRYTVRGPLVDFNREQIVDQPALISTIPFVFSPPIAALDPETNRQVTFRNPGSHFHKVGVGEEREFRIAYGDRLGFALDLRLNGNPNRQLLSVKRTVKFLAFLVSISPSNSIVVHAVSTPIVVRTDLKVGSDNVLFGATSVGKPRRPDLRRSDRPKPVTSGRTANEVSRAKLACLGILTSPLCPKAVCPER